MGSLATVPWGKAAGLGTAWAVAASVAGVLLWWWTHPTWGSPMLLFLILPPCLALALSGVVHRSARVGLLAALITAALNVGLFIPPIGSSRHGIPAAQPFRVNRLPRCRCPLVGEAARPAASGGSASLPGADQGETTPG